jgi:hypothetical protein
LALVADGVELCADLHGVDLHSFLLIDISPR